MRFTQDMVDQVLMLNEGHTWTTSFSAKNSSDDRTYTIQCGQLHVRSRSNTSWADSRGDNTWVAEGEELRRHLREQMHSLVLPDE